MKLSKKLVRKGKSPIFLDFDDLLLLRFLEYETHSHILNNNSPTLVDLNSLKEDMRISHKALLVHLNRLKRFGIIEIFRGDNEDYKSKYVKISRFGLDLYKKARSSSNIVNDMNAYFEKFE